MPHVRIKTGFTDAHGCEETLTTYLCDVPDCPETAVHVVGVVRELGTFLAVCQLHAVSLHRKDDPPTAESA